MRTTRSDRGRAAKAFKLPLTDLVISAIALALLGHVATTTLRPVFHNAAATNAELHGDIATAERHLIAAADQARRYDAQGSFATATERLAELYWQAERYAECEQQLVQLLALWEPRLGSRHPMVSEVLERLGFAAQQQGELDRAESFLRRSLEIREHARGPRHVETARSLLRLGHLYRVRREISRADLYLTRALSLAEEQAPPPRMLSSVFPGLDSRTAHDANRRVLTEVVYELSLVRGRQGRLGEAKVLAQRALALSRELDLPPTFEAATLSNLGGLHRAVGESDAALAYHREARELVQRDGP